MPARGVRAGLCKALPDLQGEGGAARVLRLHTQGTGGGAVGFWPVQRQADGIAALRAARRRAQQRSQFSGIQAVRAAVLLFAATVILVVVKPF